MDLPYDLLFLVISQHIIFLVFMYLLQLLQKHSSMARLIVPKFVRGNLQRPDLAVQGSGMSAGHPDLILKHEG